MDTSRNDPSRNVSAPRGTTLNCKSWLTEAAFRMLQNNLDAEVAEHPQALVVYGGIGRAARNWESYDKIIETLKRLEGDETLLIQSGKPVGVFKTHPETPRVLIANSNLVPHWANWEHFSKLDKEGLMMYGQMTAGSWIYIGSQGIVQGTYETFVSVAKTHFDGKADGRWILTGGLGGMGGAQPLAAVMAGFCMIAVECDESRIDFRLKTRYVDYKAYTLDEALARIETAKKEGKAISVGLLGNACDVFAEVVDRNILPDVVTDQTSAHDPTHGYLPHGWTVKQWKDAQADSPETVIKEAKKSMAQQVKSMITLQSRGAATLDYGNNIRQVALDEGVANAFDFPGFVPAYIRPLFCQGIGPFRWVALSGDPEDIYKTDAKVKELIPEDKHLHNWLDMARERIAFQGLPSRICWVGVKDRYRLGQAFNEMVKNGELSAPIVIGRDHLDSGSVASPNRETESMMDGSDAVSDWPLLNAMLNTAGGATWVSLHHGGGVGMGFSQHSGVVIVADGTDSAYERLGRVLRNDPATGVMRHADAGYDIAKECAIEANLDLPMLHTPNKPIRSHKQEHKDTNESSAVKSTDGAEGVCNGVLELVPGELTLAMMRMVVEEASEHNSMDVHARPYTKLALHKSADAQIKKSAELVAKVLAEGRRVYGVNTGFGKLAAKTISPEELSTLQLSLVLSHAAGIGEPMKDSTVRLMMLLKINSLSRGYSGIRREVIDALITLYNKQIYPVVPCKGSVGASGDLAPLAHIACVLVGEGEATHHGKEMSGAEAMELAGLQHIVLGPKEGLALLNGTQASTALALEGLFAAENLYMAGSMAGSMSIEAAMGSHRPFDRRIHEVRGHKGQIDSAFVYRHLLGAAEHDLQSTHDGLQRRGSQISVSHTECAKVQDPYSLRCQPQVMGACLTQIRNSADILLTEANAVTDNPLVFEEEGVILSGGNFHAEPVAFAADNLALAISEIGAISERRMALLIDSAISGLPTFLVDNGGVNSGFMIAQVTAAALACENKCLAHPASVDSLPTSANQEDHVSMATHAARRLHDMAFNTAGIVGIEMLGACQGLDFRSPSLSSGQVEAGKALVRARVPFYDVDRYMAPDIKQATAIIQEGGFNVFCPRSDILPSLDVGSASAGSATSASGMA
ncbi:hypothetical protein SARC_01050 [Sphaeroforma arctica JP610]|uniref:Histidine ammonia-lyase n=1 Tax=Sphaeroforma arctica JP610 TaxID=667725 RepID=A0A0L0GEV6_9EUKA|nr:hypothetical protein SARC_01050 [Sphaeroforma arctica JP610]KNC86818.1 hypothetical protein SARC_01050 [Sphaeroforma arctica JP610]|eukprot:XP_014160720.1 hypothetical protein SARC_01050 [Sphaeroforma arctica JP610]